MAFGSTRLATFPGSFTVEYPAVGGFAITLASANLIFVPAALGSGLNWLDDTEWLRRFPLIISLPFCVVFGASLELLILCLRVGSKMPISSAFLRTRLALQDTVQKDGALRRGFSSKR